MKSVNNFLDYTAFKNPNEPEFLQAVKEIAETVIPFIEKNPKYKNAKILERLIEPDRTIIFRVPWVNDSGSLQVNRGYRVQMTNALGPYKGGLRFHPSVNLSVLKFLAFEQIFKNALTTLPLGAGKGGADFNPKGKSDNEIMRFCQSFMNELYRHIGPNTDVPAGDIGVSGKEVGYMFGQYKKLTNQFTGTITGKGLNSGGSLIRPEATGYGCVYFAEKMLARKNDSIKGKKVIISGSGNVAQFAVEKILDLGGIVLTMSDSSGFIFDKNGIDAKKLEFIKELKNIKKGRIQEYANKYNAQYKEGERPWNIAADLAIPCATQNEIEKECAKKMVENGVTVVCEGANMPSSSDAINIFKENNILFGPGKAANAGGVAVSALEMSQNSVRISWPREDVDKKLQETMANIHEQCVTYGKEAENIDYVKGANIAGFVRVANAILEQGYV